MLVHELKNKVILENLTRLYSLETYSAHPDRKSMPIFLEPTALDVLPSGGSSAVYDAIPLRLLQDTLNLLIEADSSLIAFGAFSANDPWVYLLKNLQLHPDISSFISYGQPLQTLLPPDRSALTRSNNGMLVIIPDAWHLSESNREERKQILHDLVHTGDHLLIRWPITVDGLEQDTFSPFLPARSKAAVEIASYMELDPMTQTGFTLEPIFTGADLPEPKAAVKGQPNEPGWEWILYRLCNYTMKPRQQEFRLPINEAVNSIDRVGVTRNNVAKVFLVGEFNDWQPSEQFALWPGQTPDEWRADVTFNVKSTTSEMRYKFILELDDGSRHWVSLPDDPYNNRQNYFPFDYLLNVPPL